MKRKLAVVVVCVAMLGIAGGQPPPSDLTPPPITPAAPSPPLVAGTQAVDPVPTLPIPADSGPAAFLPRVETPAPVPPPAPPTFDTLVRELKQIRDQKAELEKREKAVTEALLRKFAEQKSQLESLGIPVAAPVPRDVPKLDDAKKDEFKKGVAKPIGQ